MRSALHIRQGFGIRSKRPLRVAGVPVITLEVVSDTSIKVNWTFQKVVDADLIEIERSLTGAGGWSNVATVSALTSNFYLNTGLTAATQYFYRARGRIDSAIQGQLLSAYSTIENATTTDTAETLVQPTGLSVVQTARNETTQTVTAGWTAVPGADGYEYWFAAGADGGFSSGSSGSPLTTALTSVPGIALTRSGDDDTVELHVRATNENGAGPENVYFHTIPGNLKAPTLESVILVSGSAHGTVTPNPDADAVDEYEVERNTGAGAFSLIDTFAPTDPPPQFIDPALAPGSYGFKTRGRKDGTPNIYTPYSAIKPVFVGGGANGANAGMDFSQMAASNPNDFSAWQGTGFSLGTPGGNITVDVGIGLRYHFIGKPLHCSDQSLVTKLSVQKQTVQECWVEQTLIYSTEWTTVNSPQCDGINIPDYKQILGYLTPSKGIVSGRERWDFKVGHKTNGRLISTLGRGFPSPGVAPISGVDSASPIQAPSLWDGLPHVYRIYWKNFRDPVDGIWKEIMMSSIDGQIIHAYRDISGDPGTAQLAYFKIGANRNLGAIHDMDLWQVAFWVWFAGNNPGWPEFNNANITVYA